MTKGRLWWWAKWKTLFLNVESLKWQLKLSRGWEVNSWTRKTQWFLIFFVCIQILGNFPDFVHHHNRHFVLHHNRHIYMEKTQKINSLHVKIVFPVKELFLIPEISSQSPHTTILFKIMHSSLHFVRITTDIFVLWVTTDMSCTDLT